MFKNKIKKLGLLDIKLIQIGVVAFTLFVITIWPAAMNWVHSVNPWYFLIAMIVFMLRPAIKMLLK